MENTRRIVAAAILQDGVVYSVSRPGRHHNVIRMMYESGNPQEEGHVQGFVTNEGIFVDRKDAYIIARDAGQILDKTFPSDTLFSEDVW